MLSLFALVEESAIGGNSSVKKDLYLFFFLGALLEIIERPEVSRSCPLDQKTTGNKQKNMEHDQGRTI